ncbi:LamG-like jellyroll fold domain-containing protein [Actinoplanes palleronii]|uniref:Laminin G domain-containing protein n=1 Tax=Actinoplanes palleronii TaxID=113570 RepID=A0ABQ4BIT0_9ACTN|nr:LamG-like jellyroll fold domain-containing protein [Actinoplanes palleronii]GIE70512.1 hypothetical protein Apa02nite_066200 [Actinoplanes palleronii]
MSTLTKHRIALVLVVVLAIAGGVALGLRISSGHGTAPQWRAGDPTATPVPQPSPAVASYTFDTTARDTAVSDTSGLGHALQPRSRFGGILRPVPHGSGQAAQFPGSCEQAECPRVVLQTPSTPELNPGPRSISFGATVMLAAGQTSDGQNVLQKGYSVAGGQYKLQIDKRPGHPSCVMTSEDSGDIQLAKSDVTVADGTWHTVECRRSGTTLTILVDGADHGATTIPADLTVDNGAPLVLGGKGLSSNSDPFQGALDDVWIRISR